MLRPFTLQTGGSTAAASVHGLQVSQKPRRQRLSVRSHTDSALRQAQRGSAGWVRERDVLQGSSDWRDDVPNPIVKQRSEPGRVGPKLVSTLVKYGELAQITYDSFYGDAKDQTTFGLNKFPPDALMDEVLLDLDSPLKSYKAVKYLYAESAGSIGLRINLLTGKSVPRYWMGYVAVSSEDSSTGLRDVVFAWRGTIATSEWAVDIQSKLQQHEEGSEVLVATGFSNMYRKASEGDPSPQEQVRKAMEEIWASDYANTIGSLTVCGHSLGGALAHLCAYDLGDKKLNVRPDGKRVPITAYTYCSPRVGDQNFKEAMDSMDIKVLRTVNFRDVVPKVPGLSKDELEGKQIPDDGAPFLGQWTPQFVKSKLVDNYRDFERSKEHQYAEVGTECVLDSEDYVDLIKKGGHATSGAGRAHNLELLLYLINPDRDIALMNKSEDALLAKHGVPPAWFNTPYKGMVRQSDGTWRRQYVPYDEPEYADADTDAEGNALANADAPTPLGVAEHVKNFKEQTGKINETLDKFGKFTRIFRPSDN